MERTATLPATGFFTNFLRVAITPLKAFGSFLITLAEAGPRMDAIRRLNAMSDDDLRAKGLTREGEVRRIFGDRFYI